VAVPAFPGRRRLSFVMSWMFARGWAVACATGRRRPFRRPGLRRSKHTINSRGRGRRAAVEAQAKTAAAKDQTETLIRALRRLGFTADESRRAAAHTETTPDPSLEQRSARRCLPGPARRGESGSMIGAAAALGPGRPSAHQRLHGSATSTTRRSRTRCTEEGDLVNRKQASTAASATSAPTNTAVPPTWRT